MSKKKEFLELIVNAESVGEVISHSVQGVSADMSELFHGFLRAAKVTFQKLGDAFRQRSQLEEAMVTLGQIKRSLAGFDQITRMAKQSSSGTAQKTQEMVASAQEAADKVKELGNTVKNNILEPLKNAVGGVFENTGNALQQLTGKIWGSSQAVKDHTISWGNMNHSIFTWNSLLPSTASVTDGFAATVGKVTQQTQGAGSAMNTLLTAMGFLGNETVKQEGIAAYTCERIKTLWGDVAGWFALSVASPVTAQIAGLWSGMQPGAATAWEATKAVFSTVGSYFSETFGGAWSNVMESLGQEGEVFVDIRDGVLEGFKGVVNDMIDGVNQVVQVPFGGLNGLLQKLRDFQLGSLRPFAWMTWQAKVPKIPKLAQGAVLPANQPFLAMVGDQKHGTNIEAPLATIQEAVALVMEDYAAGNMAGHSATAELLRQILEAVLGIRIGDEQISHAYERYQAKMAVVRGGFHAR